MPLKEWNNKRIFFPFFALVIFILVIGAYFFIWYTTTHYHYLIPSLLQYLLPGVMAFICALILTPLFIFIAQNFDIVSQPGFPKEHLPPVPLLGGVVIYLSILCVYSLYWPWTEKTQAIFLGGSLLLVIGTIDDIFQLSSKIRLLGQLAASLFVMKAGVLITFAPHNLCGDIGAVLITLIWIIGIVNATNFADGIDGLAAGLCFIASSFFFIITLHLMQFHVSLITSIVAGSCLGFLIYNFKPAKIYLGDGGSTLLGFFLACFAIYGGWSDKGPIIALGIPILILGILIFDMIYITASRIYNKKVKSFQEWLDYKSLDHFHHRLINMNFKEAHAVIFIYLICVILGLSALVLENTRTSYPVILLLVQATLIFIEITLLMLIGRQIVPDRDPVDSEGNGIDKK